MAKRFGRTILELGGNNAVIVHEDADLDLAVLALEDTSQPHLTFDKEAKARDNVAVVGYPEDGPYDVRSARVRGRITAKGPDIYHRGTVRRDVYSLYATVRQGNSGGPLLTPDGKVYGVVFAKSLDDPDTGYALTVDEVREDIERGRTANQEVDSQGCAL